MSRTRASPIAVVLALGIAVAGCGPATPTPAIVPSPVAASPPASTAATASNASASVVVDPALLGALPAEVAGVAARPDSETAAEIAASDDLADSVDAIAVAVYVGPGASGAEDLAIATVAQLAPSVFSETWFRQWRDSYDAAACDPAGGVASGSAQADIGGNATFIGTCQNGVHTYHVHLAAPDRVIAITALGAERLGEQIVAGLTE